MGIRFRITLGAVLLVALLGGALFTLTRSRAPAAFALVDESTLSVLRGDVQLRRAGGDLQTVTGDVPVRVGDRIKTGKDSNAVVTYFDGSTTTLDPETDIIIRRLDKLANGG